MLPSFLRKLLTLRSHYVGNAGTSTMLASTSVPADRELETVEANTGDSLFSFVDLKDPFTPSEVAGEDRPGPILSLMGARRFELLFLFHTPHTQHKALATKDEIARRYPACRVYMRELKIPDPKNYSFVIAQLAYGVRQIVRHLHSSGTYVCVSSGTVEMRAAWFMLTASGALPAKLLQVDLPLFGQARVEDIVDTRDWKTIQRALMPSWYVSPQLLETQSKLPRVESPPSAAKSPFTQPPKAEASRDLAAKSRFTQMFGAKAAPAPKDQLAEGLVCGAEFFDKPEAIAVPGLDDALRELGIHVGSAVLRYAAERAGIAANSSLPVLLLGETGTGKERFAHLIHRLSPRSLHEMVIINCAAIPKELAESHLFGHIKGSFSGAIANKKGVFEDADQSTLFLDEVGELPLEMQAKLLRVIQDGSFQPVGSTKPLRVDVRIIAATNRDLAKEVAAGRFREDLYFRLEVLQIKLPPLRERRAEIPELALVILRQINQRRLKPRQLSKEALLRLERYDWPGNVRELCNVLERSVLYAPKESLEAKHLQMKGDERPIINLFDLPDPYEGFSLEDYLARIRSQLILRALEMSDGNQAEAGRLLDMSRQAINKFLTEKSDNLS